MTPRVRPLPLAAGLALAAALILANGCMGEDPAPRHAVVQRDFAWEPLDAGEAPPPEPLTRLWDFEDEDHPWVVPRRSGQARTADGILRVSAADGELDVLGPGAGLVEAELHHWLTLRARSTTARTLRVFWKRDGEIFSPHRSTSALRLDDSGEWATYSIAMSSLRGVREFADAAEGVDSFRLRFAGHAKGPVEVEIDRIVLLSDHDDPEGRGFAEGRLMRHGVARHGVALRAPGGIVGTVPAAGPDRWRLSLAVVGADEPVTVTVGDEQGRIEPWQLKVHPGAPWLDLKRDLPSRSTPLRLTVRAEAPEGSRAVVLVGNPMRLERILYASPAVVLYVEDTLRADHLSTYGYARSTDPHLAGMAAQGATFTRAWSTSNWTRPSISSMLTSLDPVAHGNQMHTRRVPEALTTLAEALGEAGWITASFVTNYHAGSWAGLDQGFDVAAEPWAYGASSMESTLTSAALAEPLAAFLAEHADEQVLVFVHTLDPHAPYQPEAEDMQVIARDPAKISPHDDLGDKDHGRWRQATRGYDAEVLHNDRELAALDAALARLGLADDTLFVFASDHGEAFGERGHWEHRQNLHEEQVRVPWILRWPGEVAAGRRIDTPVSLLDLAPTVLGLLDVAAPEAWQGRDLSPQLRDDDADPARPAPIFLDAVYGDDRPDKTHEIAVVNWPHKLIASVRQDGELRPASLFDLARDPGERTDLSGRSDQEQALQALLAIARERLDAG
ncbi:MAG: sulfatase, partial [Planctomycetota bacterium]